MQSVRSAGLAALLLGALMVPAAEAQRVDTLRLSMEDAVGRASRAADEARIAAMQVEVADAQLEVARAGALPQLRLSGGYTRVFESARGSAVGRFFSQPNTYTVNANLSQPLFQGGRAWAATRAAGRVRGAARWSAAEIEAQLSLDVQRAYLAALYAGRIVDIQAGNLTLAADRVAQVERFEGAGRAARYDVLRARVERANIEPLVVQARSDQELAILELKRLLNLPPELPLVLTTVLDPAAVQPLLAGFASDTGDDGGERASVRAAELLARARRDAIAIARADLMPTISVFANAGFQAFPLHGFPTERGRVVSGPCAADPAQTCTIPTGDWFADQSAGISVSWPIFDGLRTKGNIDLARAQLRLAELELGREREAVAIEVARARGELQRARSLFEARRQTAAEAGEAFSLASLRFTRGLSTQLDVSDAQLALLTAQTNEARAVFDLYLAGAELARALGRPIPLPSTAPPPAIQSSQTSRSTSPSGSSASPSHR
jgi:outer membrane protein TolC